jgi:hypothetical protein
MEEEIDLNWIFFYNIFFIYIKKIYLLLKIKNIFLNYQKNKKK